ncbi:hypothetical protein CAL7716_014830 [Calothrix sp. PCC 7716]|nr:hypothetical protein CAL7716_014830 [Calothrix sp. PCC 7716]
MNSFKNTFLLHILLAWTITFFSNNVLAQIIPDETLGAERSIITPKRMFEKPAKV